MHCTCKRYTYFIGIEGECIEGKRQAYDMEDGSLAYVVCIFTESERSRTLLNSLAPITIGDMVGQIKVEEIKSVYRRILICWKGRSPVLFVSQMPDFLG
jgi:hypothetical protein